MLGDAIAESGGAELLEQVETLRKAAIAFRGAPTDARRRRVTDLVAALDLARAEDVIRAFTCYFQLVNLAEERHRVRTLRARSRSGKPVERFDRRPRGGSGVDRDLRITPVLTAHPTEAKRRAVVEHLWRIGALLEQLEDRSLGASEEQEIGRTDARGDRGPVAHRPHPAATGPSRSTRCAPSWRCSIRRSSPRSRRSTARWIAGSTPTAAARDRRRSNRSCDGTRGSAAIATATRA